MRLNHRFLKSLPPSEAESLLSRWHPTDCYAFVCEGPRPTRSSELKPNQRPLDQTLTIPLALLGHGDKVSDRVHAVADLHHIDGPHKRSPDEHDCTELHRLRRARAGHRRRTQATRARRLSLGTRRALGRQAVSAAAKVLQTARRAGVRQAVVPAAVRPWQGRSESCRRPRGRGVCLGRQRRWRGALMRPIRRR
jgi:hypothetical protein